LEKGKLREESEGGMLGANRNPPPPKNASSKQELFLRTSGKRKTQRAREPALEDSCLKHMVSANLESGVKRRFQEKDIKVRESRKIASEQENMNC
jgi:hypothetical protein